MYFENFSSNGFLSDTLRHNPKACCGVKKPPKDGANACLQVMPFSARLSL
jgi:hypothetical protein